MSENAQLRRAGRDALASFGRKIAPPSGIVKSFQLAAARNPLSVLCPGAHSDDIEIGAGAPLLGMMARGVRLDVHWCVLSGIGDREREVCASRRRQAARDLRFAPIVPNSVANRASVTQESDNPS